MGLGLGDLPLVERLAVAERETGHELAAIERERLLECPDAGLARRVRLVPVAARPTQRGPELPQVDVGLAVAKRDGGPVDGEGAGPEAGVQHRKRPAQSGTGVSPIGFRPEERRKRLAACRAARHREVGEQRDRLARVDGEGRTRDLDPDRAEELDGDAGAHDATVRRSVLIP